MIKWLKWLDPYPVYDILSTNTDCQLLWKNAVVVPRIQIRNTRKWNLRMHYRFVWNVNRIDNFIPFFLFFCYFVLKVWIFCEWKQNWMRTLFFTYILNESIDSFHIVSAVKITIWAVTELSWIELNSNCRIIINLLKIETKQNKKILNAHTQFFRKHKHETQYICIYYSSGYSRHLLTNKNFFEVFKLKKKRPKKNYWTWNSELRRVFFVCFKYFVRK